MTAPAPTLSWEEANQRHLMAALSVVRSALGDHVRRSTGGEETPADSAERGGEEESLAAATAALPAPSALDRVCSAFRLSSFERSVLLLCAGVELDSRNAAACAAAHGDARKPYATFGLALAALPTPHWSAVTPGGPLRRWRLVEPSVTEGLVTAPLRIDERVLHFLTGVNQVDDRLRAILYWLTAASELPASQSAVAAQLRGLWSTKSSLGELPVIQLGGADLMAQQGVAAAAAESAGFHLLGLRHGDLPAAAAERDTLSRLWEREALLGTNALFIDADEMSAADCARNLVPFLEATQAILFVARREPLRARLRPILRFEVPVPAAAEQRQLWHTALGEQVAQFNGEIERVIGQFNLGPAAIRAAAASVNAERDGSSALWESCRLQARPGLDDLAQRISPAATWDDLVLPEPQHLMLREIAAQVRQRMKVYETWGFAGKGARGLGVSALFAGASGTGKTLAAEVLAAELHLDLYRIDLSSVVSKYIGETEKNLRRVFDAAESGGAILLFDEADALFGKRSEVKDSHDRYANIEVSYLLQRMEAYRGLAILTTNMKEALDSAFLRRLRFIVQFPFPDVAQRAEIWRRVLPKETPTADIVPAKLARLNVAGGNIRNVALNAAFLAADAGEPVRMSHLLRAARSEYVKLEKTLPESEVADWISSCANKGGEA